MLTLSKSNQAVYVLYAAKNFGTGKTVTMNVYNGSNTEISGSPFTLTEIGTTGLYGASFTPTATGEFKIIVHEGSSKQASASIKITNYDIESVGGDVTSVKTILEHATYGNAAIKTKLDDMAGSGFVSSEDSLEAIKNYLVSTIQASISQIQNNTSTAVSISTEMLRPSSGSTPFKIFLNIYDSEGLMQDADDQDSGAGNAYVSVNVTDELSNDRTGNLTGLDASTFGGLKWMTRISTGRYSCVYNVASTHDLEQLNFEFRYQIATAERVVDRSSVVTDVIDITSTVDSIYSEVTNGTYGLSALRTLIAGYLASGGSIEQKITSIESKIDILDTVADNTYAIVNNGTYGLAALKTLIDGITGYVDTLEASMTDIKGTGFATGTDSMKAISDRQQAAMGAGFDSGTDSLEQIRNAIDSIGTTNGGYIC